MLKLSYPWWNCIAKELGCCIHGSFNKLTANSWGLILSLSQLRLPGFSFCWLESSLDHWATSACKLVGRLSQQSKWGVLRKGQNMQLESGKWRWLAVSAQAGLGHLGFAVSDSSWSVYTELGSSFFSFFLMKEENLCLNCYTLLQKMGRDCIFSVLSFLYLLETFKFICKFST